MWLSRSILLADDDDDDHLIFKDAIREIDPGISCDTASDGKMLLDKLSASARLPDILFLDINMPLLNGFECLSRIKKNAAFSTIPVVIYSTAANDSAIETARILGADLFLSKPPDHRQLNEKLKKVLSIFFTGAAQQHSPYMHEFFI
jgi:CheY-like chemotaxis protein